MTAPIHQSHDSAHASRHRQQGQVIIMFALLSTAMIGMLGLAVDLGFTFAGKRTVQNAADGAALAGARAVAKWTATTPTSAQSEAEAIALAATNTMSISTQTLVSCEYVDYSNAVVGSCAGAMPASARGVKAVVEENHDTFFIQAVPGAPDEVTTRASAIANVQQLSNIPAGPYVVCGSDAWETARTGGGADRTVNLLLPDDTINPIYVGRTFRIADNAISNPPAGSVGRMAGCGQETFDARWDGNTADNGLANIGRTVPGYFSLDPGLAGGNVAQAVSGIGGCGIGARLDCVMILPIAKRSATPEKLKLWVVGFAPFRITSVSSSGVIMNAKLLSNFLSFGPSTATWCRTCGGVPIIRLVD